VEPVSDALYDASFFAIITSTAAASARRVVPPLVQWLKPRSVVDVGCGEGAWLAEFLRAGCRGVGVDGPAVDPARLLVPRDAFLAHDLERPLGDRLGGERFDLAVCLEVAEHLSSPRADGFLDDLTGLSDRVLFSAAVPGQGGYGHVNEQPHEYWIRGFEERGYAVTRLLRRWIADDEAVASWYRANLLLFVRVIPA
jgi:SAM-dependent methyltransferase